MPGELYFGDNLDILRGSDFPDESVDLIYLDPPFNSKKDYNLIFKSSKGKKSDSQIHAFEDTWKWGDASELAYRYLTETSEHEGRVPVSLSKLIASIRSALGDGDVTAYLMMMGIRMVELHRVMKPTASIYLHCDPAASHYLKIVMDALWGAPNFRREIVWRSGWVSGFKSKVNNWVRNHDILLYYVKDHNADFTFNKELAYRPHAPDYERRGGGENPLGVALDDVWDENALYSPWIKSFSSEKLGYPTQKPLALLERIITVSSNEGDLVLDPFCGCGTALAAAEKHRRHWKGIDITPLAIAVIKARLMRHFGLDDIPVNGEPADLAGAKALALGEDGRHKFQLWAVSKIGGLPTVGKSGSPKKGADAGIDGLITFLNGPRGTDLQQVVVSVKSGNVGVKDVRDLAHVTRREGAAIGVLVTLKRPTKPMEAEAVKEGFFKSEYFNRDYRRIQIITAEELTRGAQPNVPPYRQTLPEAAPIKEPGAGTLAMDFEGE